MVCISVFSSELGTYDAAQLRRGRPRWGSSERRPAGGPEAGQQVRPVGGHPAGRAGRGTARWLTSTRSGWCPPRRTGTTAAWLLCNRSMRRSGLRPICAWAWRASRRTRGSPCSRAAFRARPCGSSSGPATPAGYFPIINAATTDFSRPFAMHLPRNEVASGRPLQMQARRLQFLTGEKTLPARQLWGAVFGELK